MKRQLVIWIALTGLVSSIIALSFVSVDRSKLPIMLALVVFGSICWLICWRFGTFRLPTILLFAIIFRVALIGLPPSLSDDAYRYIWDGLVQHEGLNPYQFPPEEVPVDTLKDDSVYNNLNSKSFISVYPPVSQYIFRFGSQWHNPNSYLSYYLIKVIFVLAELIAIFVLARIVSSGFVLFYAWNPVIIIETAGQAHTESAVLLALVLVIYFAQKNQSRWSSVFLSIAGCIKLYPFIFFPFLWRRHGWRSVWPGVVVTILLCIPYLAPYIYSNVSTSLDLYARFFEFNAGLYYALKAGMQWLTGEDWSKQLGPMLRTIFICGLPLIYLSDKLRNWSLPQAMLVTTGCYFVLTTTIHPWYLTVPIFLSACLQAPKWHWIWLAICSIGTYLSYTGGPYWIFVICGWTGWVIIVTITYLPDCIQNVMRFRAGIKFRTLQSVIPRFTPPLKVLDLGCAEGFLGERIQDNLGASVSLADITSMNQTKLPHHLLTSGSLPWPAKHFDIIVLYYVLHHAEDSEALLREAIRICRGRVIVVESVYNSPIQYQLLTILDRIANRIRSFGKMNSQEKFLHFRSSTQWRKLFEDYQVNLISEFKSGFGPMGSAGFVLYVNRDRMDN